MKSLILILMLFPAILYAQDNSKYMTGAVPEANGKVVFSREVKFPGYSKEQIYQKLSTWASGYFVPNGELQSQIIYTNPDECRIACLGQEYLVFTAKTLVLDQALINYQMHIDCFPGKADMKISAILYIYNNGKSVPDRIRAEQMITDNYALNKTKTKMYKENGKFRTHTIELADRLFSAATAAIGQPSIPAVSPEIPVQQSIPANIGIPATAPALAGYKQITPDRIPGNIFKMLSEDWMLITAGNDNLFNMMTASWGGLGHLYNKPVAFSFVSPEHYTYQLMEKQDTYTLSFFTETYREALRYCGSHSGKDTDKVKGSGLTPLTTPAGSKAFSEAWMIIECRKIKSELLEPAPSSDEKPVRMYIGEIINVWVR